MCIVPICLKHITGPLVRDMYSRTINTSGAKGTTVSHTPETRATQGNLDTKLRELVKRASDAREFAYCPYSGFRVGAALLTDENQVFYNDKWLKWYGKPAYPLTRKLYIVWFWLRYSNSLALADALPECSAYLPEGNIEMANVDHWSSLLVGCNVENASYGLSICAERVALVKAVSKGHKFFKAIAIAGDSDDFVGPCGACRQFMVEFGLDWDVYLVKPDLSWKRIKVGELLPIAFSPEMLLTCRE